MSPAPAVAIVGAGEIGSGWAALFALYGFEVRIVDPDPRAVERAHDALACARTLRTGAKSGRIVRAANPAAAVRGVLWVQESVPEGLVLKRTVLAQLDGVLPPDAIVASSTSTLGATVLGEGRSFASRLAGRTSALSGVRGAGGRAVRRTGDIGSGDDTRCRDSASRGSRADHCAAGASRARGEQVDGGAAAGGARSRGAGCDHRSRP